MKKLTLGVLAASISMVTAVQANKLDGAFGSVSLSMNSAEMDASDSTGKVNLSNDGNTIGLGFNVGYGQSFDKLYLGGDFGYKTAAGKSKLTLGGNTYTTEVTNVMGFSVLPGYYIEPETLLFARLGMNNVKVEAGGALTGSETADATILGFGVKHVFNQDITGLFEYQQLTGDKTVNGITYDLTATSFNFGLQYNF